MSPPPFFKDADSRARQFLITGFPSLLSLRLQFIPAKRGTVDLLAKSRHDGMCDISCTARKTFHYAHRLLWMDVFGTGHTNTGAFMAKCTFTHSRYPVLTVTPSVDNKKRGTLAFQLETTYSVNRFSSALGCSTADWRPWCSVVCQFPAIRDYSPYAGVYYDNLGHLRRLPDMLLGVRHAHTQACVFYRPMRGIKLSVHQVFAGGLQVAAQLRQFEEAPQRTGTFGLRWKIADGEQVKVRYSTKGLLSVSYAVDMHRAKVLVGLDVDLHTQHGNAHGGGIGIVLSG